MASGSECKPQERVDISSPKQTKMKSSNDFPKFSIGFYSVLR